MATSRLLRNSVLGVFVLLLRGLLGVLWPELLELAGLFGEEALVPNQHIIEFILGHNNRIQLLQGLVLFEHDSQHVQPVPLDLLNWVSIQGQ